MVKFIIFGKNHYQYNGFDINKYIYSDAIAQDNVLYIEPEGSVWHRYLGFFYNNEYGIALRKKLFVPFRNTAYKAFLKKSSKINKTDDSIFVFFLAEPWFFEEKNFLQYLRKQYPRAKLVYHITNIVQNIRRQPKYYQESFDLVSTCSKGDSITYTIPFFPNVCSYIHFEDNHENASDCFFVGQAKNRFSDLITIFELLTSKGVKCEFFISGVKEADMRYRDRIHYNQVLDYDVVLRKIEKTNVILELLQEGMDSYTLRYPEAVNYGKKLVTNNPYVVQQESYSERNIRLISRASDVSDIDTSFFKLPLEEPYQNTDSVSSLRFLTSIRENLGL